MTIACFDHWKKLFWPWKFCSENVFTDVFQMNEIPASSSNDWMPSKDKHTVQYLAFLLEKFVKCANNIYMTLILDVVDDFTKLEGAASKLSKIV